MKMPYKIKCLWGRATHSTAKEQTYSAALAYAQTFIRTHSTKDRRPEWHYTITNTDTGETWAGTVA